MTTIEFEATRFLTLFESRNLVLVNPISLGARGEDKRVLECGVCAYFSVVRVELVHVEFVGAEEWSHSLFLLFFSKRAWFWLNQFL